MRMHIIAHAGPPVFGESSFTCRGEDRSIYDLILCDGQYYVCGLFGIDFDQPATALYTVAGDHAYLYGFEI